MSNKTTAGGFDGCTREQQKQLLEFFMYRLGGQKCDLREELAASLPTAYNAWHGRDIVAVVSTSDTSRRWNDPACPHCLDRYSSAEQCCPAHVNA